MGSVDVASDMVIYSVALDEHDHNGPKPKCSCEFLSRPKDLLIRLHRQKTGVLVRSIIPSGVVLTRGGAHLIIVIYLPEPFWLTHLFFNHLSESILYVFFLVPGRCFIVSHGFGVLLGFGFCPLGILFHSIGGEFLNEFVGVILKFLP